MVINPNECHSSRWIIYICHNIRVSSLFFLCLGNEMNIGLICVNIQSIKCKKVWRAKQNWHWIYIKGVHQNPNHLFLEKLKPIYVSFIWGWKTNFFISNSFVSLVFGIRLVRLVRSEIPVHFARFELGRNCNRYLIEDHPLWQSSWLSFGPSFSLQRFSSSLINRFVNHMFRL